MATKDDKKTVRCSFCNKAQEQVRKIIAGPNDVYICDECVDICAEIMEEEFQDYEKNDSDINLLKPKEIKDFLDEYVIGQDDAKRTLAVAVYMISRRDIRLQREAIMRLSIRLMFVLSFM